MNELAHVRYVEGNTHNGVDNNREPAHSAIVLHNVRGAGSGNLDAPALVPLA